MIYNFFVKYKDFHDLKDFYHLIKNTARLLLTDINIIDENNNFIINAKVIESIERNFGG